MTRTDMGRPASKRASKPRLRCWSYQAVNQEDAIPDVARSLSKSGFSRIGNPKQKLNRPGETLARLPPTRRDARQAAAHQIQIGDPATVLEIHEWKRKFNGRVR